MQHSPGIEPGTEVEAVNIDTNCTIMGTNNGFMVRKNSVKDFEKS